jgi:signal transduction histidine kinase
MLLFLAIYPGTYGTLSQILYNLGSNAVKYTATGSVVITVSGERLEAVDATLDTTAPIKKNKAQRNRQRQPPRRHQWCWRRFVDRLLPIMLVFVLP